MSELQQQKKQAKTSKKKLTPRVKKLVEKLADPKVKSVAEAGRKAGFAPSTIRSTVYGIVADPFITEAVERRRKRALAHHQVTPEEVIGSAVFNMRSSIDDALDEKGSFDIKKARETGVIDVIKKHKETTTVNLNNGEMKTVVEIELESPASARKEVANYIGLEKSPQTPIKSFTDLDLAKELMQRLIDKKGWTEAEAIEGIQNRFPELDIKLLTENNDAA